MEVFFLLSVGNLTHLHKTTQLYGTHHSSYQYFVNNAYILSQSELEECKDEEKRRELEKEKREYDEVNSVDTKQL